VFVVSCPCAFILATPTAMVAALSAAARLGIFDQERRRYRKPRPKSTPLSLTNRHADHRPAGGQPAHAAWRNQTGGIVAMRGVGGKIQQPSDRQGARTKLRVKPACRWPSRRILRRPPDAA